MLLVVDLSEARGLFEVRKIEVRKIEVRKMVERMPSGHALPIQVLATKNDLEPVEQVDLDTQRRYTGAGPSPSPRG